MGYSIIKFIELYTKEKVGSLDISDLNINDYNELIAYIDNMTTGKDITWDK
jgi:hypothetical protein